MGEDDRQREVPFGRDNKFPGERRAGGSEGTVHADPARRHDQAEDGDGAQDGERGPGQSLLIEQEVADPQHQAPHGQQRVRGNHRHGQAGRSRALELAVVLDDPDNQENQASENGDHPGEQGGDAHLDLISGALDLISDGWTFDWSGTGRPPPLPVAETSVPTCSPHIWADRDRALVCAASGVKDGFGEVVQQQRLAGEQVQLGSEALGHLHRLGQLRVADDHHAVADQGGPPVPPRRADREQFQRGDVLAVAGQQAVQALVAGDPAGPRARLKTLPAL